MILSYCCWLTCCTVVCVLVLFDRDPKYARLVCVLITCFSLMTNKHPFNGRFSGTTRVSQYQKGKTVWILLKQEAVSSGGISWAVCKSASSSRQITMPAPHHLVFYRLDALPAAQPTASALEASIACVVLACQATLRLE